MQNKFFFFRLSSAIAWASISFSEIDENNQIVSGVVPIQLKINIDYCMFIMDNWQVHIMICLSSSGMVRNAYQYFTIQVILRVHPTISNFSQLELIPQRSC